MSQGVLGHARASVAEGDPDVSSRPGRRVDAAHLVANVDVGGLDHQAAAVRHRVAGVDRQVDDHLLELAGVRSDAAEIGRRVRLQRDVLADDAPQHPFHVGDQPAEIDRRRLDHLLAAERQELACQRRRGLAGALHVGQRPVDGIDREHVVQHRLDVSEDDRQQVVEVVRHAAGQPAHRFHLLGLTQLFLQAFAQFARPLALGDVVHHRGQAQRLARFARGDDEHAAVDPKRSARPQVHERTLARPPAAAANLRQDVLARATPRSAGGTKSKIDSPSRLWSRSRPASRRPASFR